MFLSLSDAAKMAKVSRATLYKLRKEGKLSFHTTPSGKQTVDGAELSRLYHLNVSPDTKGNTSDDTSNHAFLLQKENEFLKEKILFLERHIKTLENTIDKEQERITSLLHVSEKLLLTHDQSSSGLWQKLANLARSK